jgi:hypothetical protein
MIPDGDGNVPHQAAIAILNYQLGIDASASHKFFPTFAQFLSYSLNTFYLW